MSDTRIASVLVSAFLGLLSGNMMLSLVSPLRQEFSVSGPEVLPSIISYMALCRLQALLGDVLGCLERKKTMLAGLGVYAIGSILCTASLTLATFLGARVTQGIG